jgi:hypothetical protein
MNPIKTYYNGLADRLTADHAVSGAGGHAADTGTNREVLIQNFLNKHLASKLSVSLGGRIVGYEQPISSQIDVVVKNDLSPRFDQNEKSFLLAESLVSAVTIKSNLTKESIRDALANLASIPQLHPEILTFKALKPNAFNEYSKAHPRLLVFAFGGVTCQTAIGHIEEFYRANPSIPVNRKPAFIVVNGEYSIQHSNAESTTFDGTTIPANQFYGVALPKEYHGYPLAGLINSISSCLGWLPYMDLNAHKYFNSSYWGENEA